MGPLTSDNYEMDKFFASFFHVHSVLEQSLGLGNAGKILINNFMIVEDVEHSGYEI